MTVIQVGQKACLYFGAQRFERIYTVTKVTRKYVILDGETKIFFGPDMLFHVEPIVREGNDSPSTPEDMQTIIASIDQHMAERRQAEEEWRAKFVAQQPRLLRDGEEVTLEELINDYGLSSIDWKEVTYKRGSGG